jgi:hypothetical protein
MNSRLGTLRPRPPWSEVERDAWCRRHQILTFPPRRKGEGWIAARVIGGEEAEGETEGEAVALLMRRLGPM